MTSLSESLGADSLPIHEALAAGVDVLSGSQTINFTPYVRTILPVDGYIFWVNAGLLPPEKLAIAGLTDANPVTVQGSLHYSSQGSMDADETIVIRRVELTSEQMVDAFAEVASDVLFLGIWVTPWGSFKFSFGSRSSYYEQANLHHYVGDAIYPAFESQIIDTLAGFDQRQIVSNSLPLWLAMLDNVPYPSPITTNLRLYPAFLVPDNLTPPYGVVDITDNSTQALQGVPFRDSNSSSFQLVSDRVLLTFYGLRNDEVMDFRDYVFDYSTNTDTFGLMNTPVPRDVKRTQLELTALAMKKSLDFEVSYVQTRMRDLARQLIKRAFLAVSDGQPFPQPIPAFMTFDIPFQYLGNPTAGSPVLLYTFVENFSLLNGLVGCAATARVVAAVSTVFDLAVNGVNFGTMTFSPGISTAVFAGSAQLFNPSDVLSVIPRTTDATLAFLTGNLLGTTT